MTVLALLRHAETAWSRDGRIQGRADLPLLEHGPLSMPEACRGMRIVTSPLARCVQTAARLGAPDAEREPRIIEMDWGAWQGQAIERLRAQLGQAMLDNEARGLDFMPPRGESPRLVLERVKPWLRAVAASGKPTLAVTHRGVIRAILAEASGWDMRAKPPWKLDWAAVQLFALDGHGTPSIRQLNAR